MLFRVIDKLRSKPKESTISVILRELWVTTDELYICYDTWICNWCGWKWWINFTNIMRHLPLFKEWKGKKLEEDIFLVCLWHDMKFAEWWNILDFLTYNLIFSISIFRLTNWTLFIVRLLIFITLFTLLNVIWWKYFNWW